jgi:hypothetical protein
MKSGGWLPHERERERERERESKIRAKLSFNKKKPRHALFKASCAILGAPIALPA